MQEENLKNLIILPKPSFEGKISLEEAILKRRSIRDYKKESLSLKEMSQVLWAAQGINDTLFGKRTIPSAGALYPLEVYLAAKNVEKIPIGVFKYQPEKHALRLHLEGEAGSQLASSALGQGFIRKAPAVLVLCAVFERMIQKYGKRGIQYVFMEAGHAAQNVYLQAESLNLGIVTVGAFDENEVKNILKLADSEVPLYIVPIGKK